MTISIIAAISDNGVIGRDNALPWHVSSDLKRFKSLTIGHHLLMGRKTFESIGRPLPGRSTIVVTRNSSWSADGVQTAASIEEALRLANDDREIFIAGGAEIYRQTLRRADRLYITRVHAEMNGDAFFPEYDDVTEWRLEDSEHFDADDRNEYPFSFLTYRHMQRPELPVCAYIEQG
jgi:dihydrofolate reductase